MQVAYMVVLTRVDPLPFDHLLATIQMSTGLIHRTTCNWQSQVVYVMLCLLVNVMHDLSIEHNDLDLLDINR